jgi:hypothetical protein
VTGAAPRLVGTDDILGRRLYLSVTDDILSWNEDVVGSNADGAD